MYEFLVIDQASGAGSEGTLSMDDLAVVFGAT